MQNASEKTPNVLMVTIKKYEFRSNCKKFSTELIKEFKQQKDYRETYFTINFVNNANIVAINMREVRINVHPCGKYIGLVSLFNGISTFVGHLMPKLFS